MPNQSLYELIKAANGNEDSASFVSGFASAEEANQMEGARRAPVPANQRSRKLQAIAAAHGGPTNMGYVEAELDRASVSPDAIIEQPSTPPGRVWWDAPLEKVLRGIEFIDIPRQAVLHTITGDDIRKAVPAWMLSRAEKDYRRELDVAYEMINFGDVVDNFSDDGWARWREARTEGNWFERNIVRRAGSVAMFLGDVVLDPVSYVAGPELGLGKKITASMRKILPKSAVASIAAKKVAMRPSRSNTVKAVKAMGEFAGELADKVKLDPTNAELKGDHAQAVANFVDMVDNLSRFEYEASLGADAVGTRLARHIPELPPNATELDKALHAQRTEALNMTIQNVRADPNDLRGAILREELGPDAVEEAGEVVARTIAGAHEEDTLLKQVLDPFAETRTTLNTPIPGVGVNGEIMLDRVGMEGVRDALTTAAAHVAVHLDFLEGITSQGTKRIKTITRNVAKVDELRAASKAVAKSIPKLEKQLAKADATLAAKEADLAAALAKRTSPKEMSALRAAHKEAVAPLQETRRALKKELRGSRALEAQHVADLNKALQVSGLTGEPEVALRKFVLQEQVATLDEEIGVMANQLDTMLLDRANMNAAALVEADAIRKGIRLRKAVSSKMKRALSAAENKSSKLSGKADDIVGKGAADAAEADATLDAMKMFEKELTAAKEQQQAIERAMRHYEEFGVFPPEIYERAGIKLPKGPRRDVLSSANYLNAKYGSLRGRLLTPMLTPRSSMYSALPMFMQLGFREPMRILNDHIPGLWELINGRTRSMQYEVNFMSTKIRKIMREAGILLDAPDMVKGAEKVFLSGEHNIGETLHLERNELLFDLMNAKPGSDDYIRLSLAADEAILKAERETRALLEYYNVKMGFNKTETIEHYIRNIIDGTTGTEGRSSRAQHGANSKLQRSFERKRKGNGKDVRRNYADAMDEYVRSVTKKLYLDPLVGEVDMAVARWGLANNSNAMNSWGKMLTENIAGLPSSLGSHLDKLPKELVATPARRATAGLSLATYTSALAGNTRYFLMSMITGINTTSAEFGLLRTLKGLARAFSAEGVALTRAAGLENLHKQVFSELASKWGGLASDIRVFFPSVTDTEMLLRGTTFHASIDAQLNEMGLKILADITDPAVLKEVFAEAVNASENLNHVFGALARPVGMERISKSGSSLATQFFSFPFKQTETLMDLAGQDAGFFFDYLVMAGQMTKYAAMGNIDISAYTGVNYAPEAMSRDMTSMPVETLGHTVNWVHTFFDPMATPLEKHEATKGMLDGIDNLKPMAAHLRNIKKGKSIVNEGKVFDSHGNLVLKDVKANPLQIMFGMKSMDESRERAIKDEVRFKNDALALQGLKLTELLHDQREAGYPAKEVAELQRICIQLGQPFPFEKVQTAMEKEKLLLNVDRSLRDRLEFGTPAMARVASEQKYEGRFTK